MVYLYTWGSLIMCYPTWWLDCQLLLLWLDQHEFSWACHEPEGTEQDLLSESIVIINKFSECLPKNDDASLKSFGLFTDSFFIIFPAAFSSSSMIDHPGKFINRNETSAHYTLENKRVTAVILFTYIFFRRRSCFLASCHIVL